MRKLRVLNALCLAFCFLVSFDTFASKPLPKVLVLVSTDQGQMCKQVGYFVDSALRRVFKLRLYNSRFVQFKGKKSALLQQYSHQSFSVIVAADCVQKKKDVSLLVYLYGVRKVKPVPLHSFTVQKKVSWFNPVHNQRLFAEFFFTSVMQPLSGAGYKSAFRSTKGGACLHHSDCYSGLECGGKIRQCITPKPPELDPKTLRVDLVLGGNFATNWFYDEYGKLGHGGFSGGLGFVFWKMYQMNWVTYQPESRWRRSTVTYEAILGFRKLLWPQHLEVMVGGGAYLRFIRMNSRGRTGNYIIGLDVECVLMWDFLRTFGGPKQKLYVMLRLFTAAGARRFSTSKGAVWGSQLISGGILAAKARFF